MAHTDAASRYWNETSAQWDKRAAIFDRSVVQGEMNNRMLLEGWKALVQKVLAGRRHKTRCLLDVGTGSGFLAIALAELGYETAGVDISPAMLEIAAQRAGERGVRVDFQVSDAAELSGYDSESFDAVITRYLTWALPDLKKAYAEWQRVLAPGGSLIVIDGYWNQNRKLTYRNGWRLLAWALIYVTERRRPERRKEDEIVSLDLPAAKLKRPEDDQVMLEDLGYQVKEVYPDIYPMIYRGMRGRLEYLKRCYWGPAFMIVADKI